MTLLTSYSGCLNDSSQISAYPPVEAYLIAILLKILTMTLCLVTSITVLDFCLFHLFIYLLLFQYIQRNDVFQLLPTNQFLTEILQTFYSSKNQNAGNLSAQSGCLLDRCPYHHFTDKLRSICFFFQIAFLYGRSPAGLEFMHRIQPAAHAVNETAKDESVVLSG